MKDRPGFSLVLLVVVSTFIFLICMLLIEATQPNPQLYPILQ